MNQDEKIAFLESFGVDAKTGVSNMMDIETYDEIMNDFYDSLPEEISKIDQFKNQNDMANYAIEVHGLKSDSKYLGFVKLAELSYQHEMASKQNDINYVNEHYNELINEVNRVYAILTKYKAMV